jgi:hypothetical protein
MKNICAGCYIGSECGVMTMAQTQVIAVERTASVNRKDAIAGWRCGTFWNDAEGSMLSKKGGRIVSLVFSGHLVGKLGRLASW